MLVAFAGAFLLTATAARAETLYDALGGHTTIECMIAGLTERYDRDPRISAVFDNINKDRLKTRLIDQFCTLTGGPCHFKGISMKGVHAGLHIRDYQFNALVEDLQAAMDDCHVAYWTQNRLLAILAPMRRDIVQP
jgi:hemoglobin